MDKTTSHKYSLYESIPDHYILPRLPRMTKAAALTADVKIKYQRNASITARNHNTVCALNTLRLEAGHWPQWMFHTF